MNKTLKLGLAAVAMFTITTTFGTKVSASTKNTILSTSSVNSTQYVRNSSKGTTYNFKMTGKSSFNFGKSTHYLKNYPNTTWVVTKKSYIHNKNGKTYVYYYVHNRSKTAYGWIWHGYLKKVATPKNTILSTSSVNNTQYVRNSSKGTTYNFNMTGKSSFNFGKSTHYLKNYPNTTWVVTKKSYIHNKNGKIYVYYYVHNRSKTAYGWVWHGYLKKQGIVPILSASETAARAWIVYRESSGSYTARNGSCYGKYQLQISYLHGDLSKANQERVAQNYVTSRYGSWVNAKRFWQAHNWY